MKKIERLKFKTEKGMTLPFTIILMSNILFIAFSLGYIVMAQYKIMASARDSAYAIFASTSGLERALYQVRISLDCSALPIQNLSNGASYTATISPCSSSSAVVNSRGSYRDTSRVIEASW